MDTSFHSSLGAYPFATRCEMLAELGYDATYLTLWDEASWADLGQIASVRERHGLDVAAVFADLFIDAPADHPGNARVMDLVRTVEGTRIVELTLRTMEIGTPFARSAPDGDGAALRWLEPLVRVAAERGITLALYPHIYWWMERTEDAVRLCRTIDSPALRITFPAFHWYAVDGTGLTGRLAEAAPYLALVNVCGSSRRDASGGGMPATIQPLDEGELDLFALLGAVRATGFRGPVGIQGYSVGGDAYARLRRSLAAFRDIEARLDAHPHWATLRPRG
jgi:sugar phosphate isomerase/epimerase